MKKPRLIAYSLLIAILLTMPFLVGATRATNGTVTVEKSSLSVIGTPPAISAAASVLYAPDGDLFLCEKDADERRPMASTTKIMTALVVLEHANLTDTVTVVPEAVGIEGSSIYLYAGEQLTVETLLYALLLSSANDAATALAWHVAGSISAFADLMNERAAAMGLTDTHFTNPHGLHDEAHYTTARELAKITAEALRNEHFAGIVSTVRYQAPQAGTGATRLFLNHNRLLRTYEGAVGVKTGFTKKSGRCLVSAARREGLLLIAVTLSAPSDWQDHKALFDFGFGSLEAFTPTPDEVTLPVVSGKTGTVTLVPDAPFTKILSKSHGEIRAVTELPRFLFAGSTAGTPVGQIVYYENGKVIGTVTLRTATDLPEAEKPGLFTRIRNFFIH